MKKIMWIVIAVLVTVIVFSGAIAWSVFVSLLMVGIRIVPFALLTLGLIWLYNRKQKNGKK